MSGVGSTQSVLAPAEQRAHAGWHAAQPPVAVAYSPSGQLERHWPRAERSGKTRPGQLPPLAHLFHAQLVHSVAAGPEHEAHVGSHAWHARAPSA